jgi:hypothetical protein
VVCWIDVLFSSLMYVVGKPEGKRRQEDLLCRWEDNIKVWIVAF